MSKLISKGKRIGFFLWIEITFLIFLSLSSRCLASENSLPLTNEGFLRQTINRVLEDCLKEAPLDSKLVWLKQEDEKTSGWIVEEEIVSYLGKKGEVGIGKEKIKEGDLSLSFRIIKLSLEYPEVKRKKFLGRSWVRREVQVLLSFILSDNLGEVLWSKKGEGKDSDLVKMDQLEALNNKHYTFLSPEVPESSWGKLVEPAVVTAVVGALVYLFFANR